MIENVIEWLTGDTIATLTLSKGKMQNKVLKLHEKYPEEVEIVARNKDGSILVHLPLDWIKIYSPREYSEETLLAMKARGHDLYEKYLKK